MSAGSQAKRAITIKPFHAFSAGIVLLILGVFLSDIPTMLASPKWPTTQGRIISRTLLGQKFEEYDGDYYTNIEGYIRYQYQVDGRTYTSTAVNALDKPCYSYETALNYPEGLDIQVHYHPRDPARAVLEPGWVISGEAFGLFSSLFILAGLYLLLRVIVEWIQGSVRSARYPLQISLLNKLEL